MVINPVYMLAILYLFSNTVAAIIGYSQGGMKLDGVYFNLTSESIVYAYVVQAIFLIAFLLVYGGVKKNLKLPHLNLGWFVALSILIYQLSFLLVNILFGFNVAGKDNPIDSFFVLRYLYAIVNPDVVFLIAALFFKSVRFFWINLVVFFISMVVRGWLGGVLLVFILVLCRFYPIRISKKSILLIVFAGLGFAVFFPALIEIKWFIRSGGEGVEISNIIANSFTFENYGLAFEYLLGRFQHVGHVALIFINRELIFSEFISGSFIGFWDEGLPQYVLFRYLDIEYYTLSYYLVEYLWQIDSPSWNTNSGLAGWFFILNEYNIFLILYLLMVIMLPVYFIKRFAGHSLLLLLFCFSFLYLYHGWFSAYFNFVFFVVVFLLFRGGVYRR